MKKLISLGCTFILSLSLCACGGSSSPTSSSSTSSSTTTEVKAEANVDPTTIDPGQNYSRDGITSDLWFNASNEEDYFYLQNASKEYWETGLSIYWYQDGKEILDGAKNTVEDNHLVSVKDSALEFDLMFVDLFTAYDKVSKQWYYREGLGATDVEGLFFDKTVESDNGNTLTFNEDYTVKEVYNKKELSGTWWAINSTQIIYYPEDDKEYGYKFDYYVKDDNTLDYVKSSNLGTYYLK